jgi:hypothetical protein
VVLLDLVRLYYVQSLQHTAAVGSHTAAVRAVTGTCSAYTTTASRTCIDDTLKFRLSTAVLELVLLLLVC